MLGLVLKRGKEWKCGGIELGEGTIVNEVEAEGYKYLGIVERGNIPQQELKERIGKEYIYRVRVQAEWRECYQGN